MKYTCADGCCSVEITRATAYERGQLGKVDALKVNDWAGTFKDLEHKLERSERTIRYRVANRQCLQKNPPPPGGNNQRYHGTTRETRDLLARFLMAPRVQA